MKKRLAIILLICLAVTACGGCGKGSRNVPAGSADGGRIAEKAVDVEKKALTPDSVVIAVGNEAVKYKEFMAYMYILKNRYQNSIGEGIWSYSFGGGRSFEYMAKEETVSLITELKIISRKAKDMGVDLSGDEKEDIRRFVEEAYGNIPEEEASAYGINTDLLTELYMENEIANKVYDSCISEVSADVSGDALKQVTVWYLYKSAENATDADMKKIRKAAAKTDDFKTFAEKETEAESVELTFGRGDMGEEFANAAFSLSTGQLSDVVAADGGYYLIYCVSDYNEEATNRKKEEIIAAEQKKIFEEKYEGWAAGYEVEISKLIL